MGTAAPLEHLDSIPSWSRGVAPVCELGMIVVVVPIVALVWLWRLWRDAPANRIFQKMENLGSGAARGYTEVLCIICTRGIVLAKMAHSFLVESQ